MRSSDGSLSARITVWLDDRASLSLVVVGLLTLLFAVAFVGLEDDSIASQEPDAAVFDVRDRIDDRLSALTHDMFVVVEAESGDMLTAEPLSELLAATAALRDSDAVGELAPPGVGRQPLLFERFDLDAGQRVVGLVTIADVVDQVLRDEVGVGLDAASDEMVKVAVDAVLSDPRSAGLADQLSVEATFEPATVLGREIVEVSSPALMFSLQADNEPLGGGSLQITPDDNPVTRQKERFNRNVQTLLRGEQASYELRGIAIDLNETAEEQGRDSAVFIVLAVLAAVAIVGVSMRSYWATALTGTGLAVLMVWLGGISNLVGLKAGLVIDLIVPIAMISLGVDFAAHSLLRYREERKRGTARPFQVGLGAVIVALALATLTDSAAFLANAVSGIEAIVHFAIAAAIATSSAFVVLGIVAPLVQSRIDTGLGPGAGPVTGGEQAAVIVAGIGAAAAAAGVVIMTVAVSPLVGSILLVPLVMTALVVPYYVARRRVAARAGAPMEPSWSGPSATSRVAQFTTALARRPLVVLVFTAGLTAAALVAAFGLRASFDVEDFFESDSDFVVSLEQLDRHGGDRLGEPAQILVDAELDDPDAIAGLAELVDRLRGNDSLARNADGSLALRDPQPLDVLTRLTADGPGRDAVLASTGVAISDNDGDGVPDDATQLAAAWRHALSEGVPHDEDTLVFSAAEVAATVVVDPDGPDSAVFTVGIPNPRQLDNTRAAKEALDADLAAIRGHTSIVAVGAAGSPFGRLATIDATTDALQAALPIAIVAVLVLVAVALRSIRYAIVTTIPMLLVAVWLYGTMVLFGFDLNFVTATVGAISIGVGADYAIHMTARYRTELTTATSHLHAVEAAARGTGHALVVSMVSTAAGFAIMGFAPMPLFATFGILSALMVVFAFVASLLVLPSLLGLASRQAPTGR